MIYDTYYSFIQINIVYVIYKIGPYIANIINSYRAYASAMKIK